MRLKLSDDQVVDQHFVIIPWQLIYDNEVRLITWQNTQKNTGKYIQLQYGILSFYRQCARSILSVLNHSQSFGPVLDRIFFGLKRCLSEYVCLYSLYVLLCNWYWTYYMYR